MDWNQETLQSYIDNFVEENLNLDYKAAAALELTDGKKREITKDVSAMANSDGGIIIYGLKEYQEPEKKHLAEQLDPIDRTKFSKETLEQIINNIRPHIDSLVITPVPLSSGTNDVAYVVEIPVSTTAHQATDKRYYRRFNFLSVAMEDYEIRNIMNRATLPDATVEFSYEVISSTSHEHDYLLKIIVKNLGNQFINHFQLEFTFPTCAGHVSHLIYKREHVDLFSSTPETYLIRYRSNNVLFPGEERDIGKDFAWRYKITSEYYSGVIRTAELYSRPLVVNWILYADNMPGKQGNIPFDQFNRF